MADKKFINKTNYTKSLYYTMSVYNNTKGKNYYLIIVFVTLAFYGAIRSIKLTNNLVLFYVYTTLGLLAIPTFMFIIPSISSKINYKKLMEETEGRELINTIEISDRVYSKNSLGVLTNHTFDKITTMSQYRKLFVFTFNDKSVLYMDIDGFKTGNIEELKEYLSTKTSVKVKIEAK